MASVLVVVPAVRGRPAFIPAVLHVLSDREADADVENHYRLNDVEQNNVAWTTAQVTVFVACVFHEHSIKTESYRALGTLYSLKTSLIIVQTAQLRIWHLTFDSDVYLEKQTSQGKGDIFRIFFNSDTMGSLWSNFFSPFINMLFKGVIKYTDEQLKTPYSFHLTSLILNIAMGEGLLVQESAGV
jgi:hypothetical protein